MNRWARAAGFFVALVFLAPAASAKDLPIDTFIGHFTGTGIANSKDAEIMNLRKRDLDVTIAKAGDGFSVAWTTVVRRGGLEEVDRKSTSVNFVPTESPSLFMSPERTDATGKLGYSWASIEDRTLTVYLLVIQKDNAAYHLHSYARTVDGSGKMRLKFTRISNGRPKVIVEGEMARKN